MTAKGVENGRQNLRDGARVMAFLASHMSFLTPDRKMWPISALSSLQGHAKRERK
jgi:hypothetical protein